MSQYLKVLDRDGRSFRTIPAGYVESPGAPDEVRSDWTGWPIDPGDLPATVTCSKWRDGLRLGATLAGGSRDWYRLGDSGAAQDRLDPIWKQRNQSDWRSAPYNSTGIGAILNRIAMLRVDDDGASAGAPGQPAGLEPAPVILLGTASDADVRISHTPRWPCEVKTITVTWTSMSVSAAETIAATLPGLLADRTAARVAFYEAYNAYGGTSNEAGVALEALGEAFLAHGQAYVSYTNLVREALLLQL